MDVAQTLAADRAMLDHYGMEFVSAAEGRALLRAAVADKMVNAAGYANGALTFALADTACAYALNSTGARGVTLNANISYLKGPRPACCWRPPPKSSSAAAGWPIWKPRCVAAKIASPRGHSPLCCCSHWTSRAGGWIAGFAPQPCPLGGLAALLHAPDLPNGSDQALDLLSCQRRGWVWMHGFIAGTDGHFATNSKSDV